MEAKLKYRILLWFTAIIWGSSFVATKVVVSQYSPVFAALIRFVIAYLVLLGLTRKRSGAKKTSVMWAGLWGISMYFIFENYGISMTTPTNAVLIISTVPVLHMIFFWLFGKTKVTKGQWMGAVVAFLGVGVVVTNGQITLELNPLGDLFMFGACLSWILYTFFILRIHPDKKKRESINTITVTRDMTFWGTVFLIPFAIVELSTTRPELSSLIPETQALIGLLFLGVFCSSLAYIFWNLAIKHLGAQSTTNAIYLMPIITAFFEALILGHFPHILTVVGGTMVVLGLMLSESGKKRKVSIS